MASLIRLVKLEGGPDLVELSLRMLEIEDKGGWTRNSAHYWLVNQGDKVFPELKTALHDRNRKHPEQIAYALVGCKSDEATDLLCTLALSGDERMRERARYALIHKPYRERAKTTYLQMLAGGSYAVYIGEAAAEFGWKEAIPALLDMSRDDAPYAAMFKHARSLQGRPIPPEVFELATKYQPTSAMPDVKSALLASEDQEAAAVLAFHMAGTAYKVGDQSHIHRTGSEVLLGLPRNVAREFLEKAAGNMKDEQKVKLAKDLLAKL